MGGIVLTCLLALLPSLSAADVFSDLEAGKWGYAPVADMTCANNPHQISFTADHIQVTFRWKHALSNLNDVTLRSATFTVISVKSRRLLLENIADHSRSILLVSKNGRSYRYKAADQPDSAFYDYYRPC